MESKYKIVFRGDIVPGHTVADVRARLQELFRLDDQAMAKLFSGRPVAIKKNLDEGTANKWCEVMEKAGAVADAVAEETPPTPPEPDHPDHPDQPDQPEEARDTGDYGLALAPVGADVLKPSERAAPVEKEVSTSHLSVEAVGADVLRENERSKFVELELDLSHLKLEDLTGE